MSKTIRTMTRCEAKPPKQSRSEVLALARKALAAMTDEEDAAITAAALSDPDAQPLDRLALKRRYARQL